MSTTFGPDWAWRIALWIGVAITSWLGMQIVHEYGHVLGAMATGGRVTHVELQPWTISRTDVEPNPCPLMERWSGPIVGCVVPMLAWLVVRSLRLSWAYLVRFFTGFCLIANGAYIGGGAVWQVGDAADILRIEPSLWPLLMFGIVTTAGGLALWHQLGAAFGAGPKSQPVNRAHVVGVACSVAAIILAELLVAFS
jgi:hypothetical protein